MFFRNFPKIDYSDHETRNIVLKAAIVKGVFENVEAFYPYVIPLGFRPDQVADAAYGNPKLDWIVYFSNNIVDPYYEWPLNDENFNAYLVNKYGLSIYQLQSQIHHYAYTGVGESQADIDAKSWTMTKETFDLSTTQERAGWTPVYTYDYEVEQNDAKRSIKLLSNVYVNQIVKELSTVFQ